MFTKLFNEEELVAAYLETHSTTKAAKIAGCSYETVARAVKKAGVPLDGRKYQGNNGGGTPIKITDDQLLDCCQTMSRQEIADRFNMHPASLDRRMRKLGVYAAKKTPVKNKTGQVKTADWHSTPNGIVFIEKHQGDNFEFVAYKNKRYQLRCKKCGFVIERAKSTIKQKQCRCDACEEKKKEALDLQIAREYLIRTLKASIEKKTPKVCARCGKVFYSQYNNKKYCSAKCKNKSDHNIRQRCRMRGTTYIPGISLQLVDKRDSGICQICGKPVDWNDHSWSDSFGPMYPTIDHVIALANGGNHTWDNVQLAHAICNSYKRDLAV